MKVSDYISKFLEDRGISHVFGFIGGAITHLVDSIYASNKVQFIQVYHEQTAAIAAEGYSRISDSPKKIGVAMATSGPGATNLITGIADAFFDSIPAVYITGQVNTYEYKYKKPIRQQGFQETEIVDIVKPITKLAALVDDASKIKYFLEKAFHIASSGRPGPVLLDIPMDIQSADINPDELESYRPDDNNIDVSEEDLSKAKELIKSSKRPLMLVGGGVINAKAEKALFDFCTSNNIPVVNSLMGKGAFPEDNDLHIGMIGSYGNRCANIVTANADLLIALGTRLDTRQTGTALDSFLRKGKLLHIDIDRNELQHHRLKGRIEIHADAGRFLRKINSKTKKESNDEWLDYVRKIKSKYSQSWDIERHVKNKMPYEILNALNKIYGKDQIFCVDIGQNQMFSAQMLKIRKGQKFFTSGGLAPMGYAVPAAIGASVCTDKRREVIAVTGDGGFHISTQSLMLISQYDLPIKVVVLNNESLGMITQFQDLYFGERKLATTKKSGYLVPSIKDIAKAYGLKYYLIDEKSIKDIENVRKALTSDRNAIIEVLTQEDTKIVPKLEVEHPIEDISPRLSEEELKESMLISPYKKEKRTQGASHCLK